MPLSSSDCRKRALECVRLARTTPSDTAKDKFYQLANHWQRLASRRDLIDKYGDPALRKKLKLRVLARSP
jgi:hypothetical protein